MKKPDEIKKGLGCCAQPGFDSCTDCPYKGECYDMENIKDALAYIQQLEDELDAPESNKFQYETGFAKGFEAAQPKWISVKERLPEIGDIVFVAANGNPRENIELINATLIASYWAEEGWIAEGYEEWDSVKVTHWMPLPEPPKEDNDGKP